MTNEITLAKAEFKLDLDSAGLVVMEYVPERIVPPIVIVNNASPYLVVSDLANEYILRLDLVCVAATAVNRQAQEQIDETLALVLGALPRYATMTGVQEPYELQANNATYLAANISIELEITI